MRKSAIPFVAAVMAASVALAHSGVKDPTVMARMMGMEAIAAASKTLGDMARGRADFDATKAEAARTDLIRHAGEISTLFEVPATDPKSEALPAIWEDFADFTAKGDMLRAAAEALDTSSAASIGAGMRDIGTTCRSCHSAYRK